MTDYCAKRVPDHVRDKVRVGFHIRGNAVTLYEERPHFRDRTHWVQIVVAQFRYNQKTMQWTLYCADRNSRWHNYQARPTKDIHRLLREVDSDPTGIFWG